MIPLCNRGMDLSRTKLHQWCLPLCTAGELFFGGEGRTGIPRNGKGPPTTALPKSSDMVLLVRGEVGRLSFRVDSGILKGGHVVTFPEQIGKKVSFPITSTERSGAVSAALSGASAINQTARIPTTLHSSPLSASFLISEFPP
jgi:hypothetical protein